MTPTFSEPGTSHVTLHFEASSNAPLIANRIANVYAGYGNVAFRVNVNVIPPIAPPCGTATLNPMDQFTQAVLVTGVTPGCTVELWVGDLAGLSPMATSVVATGATSLRMRLPHHLSPGQIARVLQASAPVTTFLSAPSIVDNNYVTSRYDNRRSGWNPNENILTVNSARYLRKVCEHLVDGAIRAQPLYVRDVEIPGKGKHNVVFTVTDGASVWAFDADSCVPNDKGLWVDAASNPNPRKLFDTSSGERAAIPTDIVNAWPPRSNPVCAMMLGATGTPVVDRTTNTIYVLTLLVKNNKVVYRLHALNIKTGHDQPGSPVEISDATVQFKGVNFNPTLQGGRPGLLLDRGVLYLAFGSHCDIGNYHGWVVAYDANIPGTTDFLRQLGVFNTSPTAPGSGVWQSGLGLAADGDTTIHLLTGNGPFDPATGNYGNTLLHLRLPTNPVPKEMEVVDYFTPFDWDCLYNPGDQDLGVGGPVLLAGDTTGLITLSIPFKGFVLAGGKRPKSYLIDRNCINCSGNPNRCPSTQVTPCKQACTADDPNLVIETLTHPQGMVAGPAYYTGPQGTRVFYGFNGFPLRAYNFHWLPPTLTMAEETTETPKPSPLGWTAPIPTVSSNGSTPGTGILWAVFHSSLPTEPLRLRAYDASNVTDNLFSGTAQNALDIGFWPTGGPHSGNSFQVPTVMYGKVYVGSADRLVIFAPVYPCRPVVDCNRAVAFLCRKVPPKLILQRKQGHLWRMATDSSSSDDANFSYLFDYPKTNSANYRVCFKDYPKNCMPEVALKIPLAACHRPLGLKRLCGVPGKPPCFRVEPWPVSGGEREEREDSKER